MTQGTDEELVKRVRAGDPEAAAALFTRYWRAARAAALAVSGNWADAEDAAAEGFWKALGGISALEDAGRFAAWMRTIVVRTARAKLRVETPQDPAASIDVPDCAPTAEDLFLRRELIAVIQEALVILPERLAEVFALVYFEGYESETAARFLGIPAGTLRRRLHEGRTHLREAVTTQLDRRTRMNEFDQERIGRLKAMIGEGKMADVMREVFAVRPPRPELLNLLRNVVIDPSAASRLRLEVASMLSTESSRATSEDHPVGRMARAIRMVLPEFHEWRLNPQEAASCFLTQCDYRQRLKKLLPPGFAEGRPGSFLRFTRSLIALGEDGKVGSVFDVFQRHEPNPQSHFQLADVLDFTWMSAEPITLRAVQVVLERVKRAVVPDAEATITSYAEPRYRAALQLEFAGTRAAVGGVLAEWPGRPTGVDSAHVRLLLEPWACIQSGQPVRFSSPPLR